jgi:hypothetical protein
MIHSNISHFTDPYSHLNQRNQTLNISRLMLARSVIMVGQSNISDIYRLGFFRIVSSLTLALGNVQSHLGNLTLSDSFLNLEPSEKRVVSFHLGMGLAKACAEILLGIPWLSHIKHHPHVDLSRRNTPNPPKLSIGSTNKTPKEPDLLGFDTAKQPHVFEAKGYSSGMNTSALQHAINQVSQVISISGTEPTTRVACFFDLSKTPFLGTIVDPDESNNDEKLGVTIEIEPIKHILSYYSFFTTDKWQQKLPIVEHFERKFRVLLIDAPHIYFGIDSKVHDLILKSTDPTKEVLFFVENFEKLQQQSLEIEASVGLDGSILFQGESTQKPLIKSKKIINGKKPVRMIRFLRKIDV